VSPTSGTVTTTAKGSAKAKGTLDDASIEQLMGAGEMYIQTVLEFALDLKSYGLLLGVSATNGSEQTQSVGNTKNCITGEPDSRTANGSRDMVYGISADQSKLNGFPLPSSRSALNGSKTVPIRFSIGRFEDNLDATVEWNITPL
jgi:hypothetical protein